MSLPTPPGSSRGVAAVLLLAVLLAACGRQPPQVTADDGRGSERPSTEIWIPETREVDEPDRDPDDAEVLAARAEEDAATVPEPDGHEPPGSPDGAAGAGQRDVAERGGAANDAQIPGTEDEDRRAPGEGHGNGDDEREGRPRSGPEPHETAERRDGDADPDELDELETAGACGVEREAPAPGPVELDEAVAELRATLAERWPQTHAGAWVVEDVEAGATVRVAFTERVGTAVRQLCEQFEHPELLEAVRAHHAATELADLAAEVVAERDALRAGQEPEDLPAAIRATRGRYAVVVDYPVNGLTITVAEPGAALRDAFRDRYAERIRLVAGDGEDDGEVDRGAREHESDATGAGP